ncbi:MAG: hypothetical protein K2L12_03370 [Clostridia bacterium]|nr:hypothetical protein [Clostridia bacterium]
MLHKNEENESLTDEQKLEKAESMIESGLTDQAQNVLNEVKDDSARKYYLQSRIFAAKGWIKERRKQLEFAIKAEPDNEEYKAALAETRKLEEFSMTDETYLQRAELHIQLGEFNLAEKALKNVKENSGKKYFLQSKVYKSKCWYLEQRKQLKKAVKAEPGNVEYKKELEELEAFRKTKEYKKTKQMGSTDIGSICCDACGEGCIICCCEGTCEALGNGC